MDSHPSDERTGASSVESFVERREGDFWLNAAIGAVATVLLSFVPLSPILGGGVAAYLTRGTRMAGAKVGAVSGLIAAIPVFAVITLLFGGFGVGALFGGSSAGFVVFVMIMLFGLVVMTVLAAGMGALGGYIGIALSERAEEGRREDHQPPVETETEPAP